MASTACFFFTHTLNGSIIRLFWPSIKHQLFVSLSPSLGPVNACIRFTQYRRGLVIVRSVVTRLRRTRRLEQRKARIVRIGQPRDPFDLLNLRYRGSVEDRVHRVLAQRLQNIHSIFGQIPDTPEDIWVLVAKNNDTAAYQKINAVPEVHAFEFRWERIEEVEWETCNKVLEEGGQLTELRKSWK